MVDTIQFVPLFKKNIPICYGINLVKCLNLLNFQVFKDIFWMLGEQKQNTMSYIFWAGGHDAVANHRIVQILEQTAKQVTLDNFNPV